MTNFIWQNGKFKPFEEANTHVMSHGLHYGTGVFEGIRAYEQQDGSSAILALNEHVRRMFYSVSQLNMLIPYSDQELCTAIIQTVAKNQAKSCYIRPLVYYGLPPSRVRIRPDPKTPVEVIISSYEMGDYLPDVPLNVLISEFIRIHPKSSNISAKLCGHYVNSLQALLQIDDTNYDELILLDYAGYVAEGSSENIFVVKNNAIYTPKLGTILPGITRQIVIDLARDLGYSVYEAQLLPEELFSSDEVFFTGTAVEVRGVGKINNQAIGNGNEGPITQQIKAQYHQLCRGANPSYFHLLTT